MKHGRKPNLLSVKQHLNCVIELTEALDKYGLCPMTRQMIAETRFFTEAILRKHEAKKTRKDVYLS